MKKANSQVLLIIKGIAYVEVENDESLKEALFKSGQEMNGRKIFIKKAFKFIQK